MIFSDLNRQPKDENNRSQQDPMFNIAQDKKDSTIRTVPVRNTDLPVLADRSERHCDLGAYLFVAPVPTATCVAIALNPGSRINRQRGHQA
jgi:hypothetical protein